MQARTQTVLHYITGHSHQPTHPHVRLRQPLHVGVDLGQHAGKHIPHAEASEEVLLFQGLGSLPAPCEVRIARGMVLSKTIVKLMH